ncbi:AAA domain-containing protein [Streptomyces pinistramenti]|uniref:AAA domain-containing protein n=1 Tax=Streptomyces pinistramenti TaxID=2884812 RepID=UPI001D07B499|nr:AAA domain-containing protein [Streptomyces pinistramenti]MCB5911063.1 AAA domain-containing protein [Streptomyces pinistramenti]
MVNHPRGHASDPDVIGQTVGLVNFLRDVVHSSHQRQRNDRGREHQWLAQLPESVRRPTPRNDGVLLTLDHVPQSTPPDLPTSLDGWVDPALCLDPDGGDPPLTEQGPGHELVHVADSEEQQEGEGVLRREEAGDVLRVYGTWLDRWRRWAERERAERPLRELYDRLYAWHQKLVQEDDQTELVLAVGLLTSVGPNEDVVHRHLLAQRVETSTDRRTAKLTVRLSPESALRLEDQDFLDSDDGWVRERGAALSEEITARAMNPLSPEALEQLAQWQERATTRPMGFSAEWEPPRAQEPGARLTYAPALVMRPRNLNSLLRFYDQIAETVASEGHAPLGLAQMVRTLEAEERSAWDGAGKAPLFGDDPLFPGKTNAQQRSVLGRLEHDTGVVVQGPPGTGKTHTIANLVSALLAQGQRVLVTSARDQALTVLREKLPTAVRDLCVLLLSSARHDGAGELERTINALIDQVAGSDPDELRAEIRRLSGERDEVRGHIETITEQVISLREAEYRHRSVAPGYAGTLAEIVERVHVGTEKYAWIAPVPDTAGDVPPLAVEQAQELLLLLRDGAGEPRAEGALPDPGELPSPQQVANVFAASHLSDEGLSAETIEIRDTLAGLDASVTAELASLLDTCKTALHHLGAPTDATRWDLDSWTTRALTDRLSRADLALWGRVAAAANEIREVARDVDALGLRLVSVPEDLTAQKAGQLMATGTALREHLAEGKSLRSRFPSKAQKNAQELLNSCTVNGRAPQTAEDLDAVMVHLRAHATLAGAATRWQQVSAVVGAGDLEVRLAELTSRAEQLEHVQSFGTAREHIDALLVRHGIRLTITSRRAWQDFNAAVAALEGRRAADEATAQLAAWDELLRAPVSGSHPSTEALVLVQALRDQTVDAYAEALEALAAAHRREHRTHRCMELLGLLHSAHPLLADRLVNSADDHSWEERLGLLEQSWAWAKASQFVREQRTPGLERKLEGKLGEHEARLEYVTGELAATCGRLRCLERMTQEQRSALQAYRTHMTSYGKGKGRHAGRFRAAARDAMSVAQGAVPAWVMPIPQVAEMLQAKRDAFDVVIVDEASQAGMDALFLMWLAPRVIVVGDDKQCAPSVAGKGRLRAIQDKLAAHLPDMPARLRELYTPHTNLYQLLSTFFPKVVRLEEHFRCVPEIINWSSSTFYDNKLLPLRQYGGERLEPLRTHFVEGAVATGRDSRVHNPKEAEEIVECLTRLVEDPAYQDKTMGVIVLQGFGQTRLLQSLIEQRLPATVREHHRIRVGNAASFQGDERHVILLSMVVTNPARAAGGAKSDQQAYNVAASRAQDQMWLFYSVPPDRLKPHDIRLNLLTYMENPPAALEAADSIGPVQPDIRTAPFDSLFEQQVYLQIKERGYHVVPQFPAGSKHIDLVVVGARGRLAVECDGDPFHRATREQIENDQRRDRELQRVGWTFWRVRDSDFRFDPDAALRGLWEELDRQGIRPANYTRSASSTPPAESTAEWKPLDLSSDEPLAEDEETEDEQTDDDITEDAA